MLGFYDYTVWLTYMSVISAITGVILGMTGDGHPCVAAVCLVLCGVFDTFDGRVARTKKDRTDDQKKFGIEIDSFADTLAFGVLPCSLSCAMGRTMGTELPRFIWVLFYIVSSLYVLSAVIRLANFNVMEGHEQPPVGQKVYTGLPVTTSAIVFPNIFLFQCLFRDRFNLVPVAMAFMVLLGFLFLDKRFHIKKPNLKQLAMLITFGIVEITILSVFILKGIRNA